MKKIIIVLSILAVCISCLPLPSIDDVNAAPDSSYQSELLAYYTFDESLVDMSGNGYDGVAVGSPSYIEETPSGTGKAIRLNGIKNEFINIPYNFMAGLKDYSVAFWVKDFSMGLLFSCASSDGLRSDFPRLLVTDTQKFRFYTSYDNYDQTKPFQYDCTSIMSTEWHHIVVTCSYDVSSRSAVKRLYIDGRLLDTADCLWNESYAVSICIGGNRGGAYPASLNAKLDNFRFYSSCLTGKEVSNLYQNKL